MQYTSNYNSPLGEITLASDDKGLTGLWFVGQKYYELYLDKENKEEETEYIKLEKGFKNNFFKPKKSTAM